MQFTCNNQEIKAKSSEPDAHLPCKSFTFESMKETSMQLEYIQDDIPYF